VRILKELQGCFFTKKAKILDLRNLKELRCVLSVKIPAFRVARFQFLVKYFITSLSVRTGRP